MAGSPAPVGVPKFVEVPDRYPWEWTLHSKRNPAALHQVTTTDADFPRRWRQTQDRARYEPPPPDSWRYTYGRKLNPVLLNRVTLTDADLPRRWRQRQAWQWYDPPPPPQQAREYVVQPGQVPPAGANPPGVRVPTFGTIDDPQPQQRRPLQTVNNTPAFQGDNPPPIKRHPVWGWGSTEPIFGPAGGTPEGAVADNPQPPRLWLNTVYKAWEPPYPPPQQPRPRQTPAGQAAAPGDNPPPITRAWQRYVADQWGPPDAVNIVRNAINGESGAAAPGDNPPVKSGPWQYRVLWLWQPPEPQPQQRIIVVRESGPVIVPEPEPEPSPGVGGIWVPHSFTRKRCKELLEEIARERAAAQALAPAPKKAVLAAAKATAAAVRDACDLCPAEASGEFYAEARDVVASLHRLMEADLQAKVLIARAKEVERQAIALRRAAEEADDDDAISMLLMGL